MVIWQGTWASYQIRKIAGCTCARDCRVRFPRHRLQRIPLVSDPGMHHGTCITHVPWCMSGSLTCGGGDNVPGIPGTCTTRNFTYLVRGPLKQSLSIHQESDCWNYKEKTIYMIGQIPNIETACSYIIWSLFLGYPKTDWLPVLCVVTIIMQK